MIIRINKIVIPVPLGMLSSKFLLKHMSEDVKQFSPCAGEIVKVLKEYKKQYGSWNLVEVYSPSGNTNIKIEI